MKTLSPYTLLQGGKYRVECVLGQGGFGITYLAQQTGLDRKVAVKEFFMKDLCYRDNNSTQVTGSTDMVKRFKAKFLKEARNIAKFDHPNIVRIHDVFEENGTAYYVMDYAVGGSLADKINAHGKLPESYALRYIEQLANALAYIHAQNINHLDIKPANIMLNSQGDAILIDFGLSKQYDTETGSQTSTTPVGISEGYAPIEQYRKGGVSEFSPQADIYALGATLYKMLTGTTPPPPMDILSNGLPSLPYRISPAVVNTIKKAMQPRKEDRPRNIGEFLEILKVGTSSFTRNTDQTKKEETKSIDDPNELYKKANELYAKKDYANAVPLFEKAANQGNARAQYYLGNCYFYGNGVTKDYAKAKEWYTKSANQGDEKAKNNLEKINKANQETPKVEVKVAPRRTPQPANVQTSGCWRAFVNTIGVVLILLFLEFVGCPISDFLHSIGKDLQSNGNMKSGKALIYTAAILGNDEAKCSMGDIYYEGLGVPADTTKAVKWHTKAAEEGIPAAQNYLGNCYYWGKVVSQDYAKAVEWYRKAANQGNAAAQNNLGYCYQEGKGISQDYAKAVEWYTKAAEQGDAAAQYNLGYCYQEGKGISQDYAKAVEWYTKAADQGLAEAQYNLGQCYHYGNGVDQDEAKAVEWCMKSAYQGYATAQYNLGYCYQEGKGVVQDYAKAVEWYTKAANQGSCTARYYLGNCYYNGLGVQKNIQKAKEWYAKAAKQGFEPAKKSLETLK